MAIKSGKRIQTSAVIVMSCPFIGGAESGL
jgi:hypothetical protein